MEARACLVASFFAGTRGVCVCHFSRSFLNHFLLCFPSCRARAKISCAAAAPFSPSTRRVRDHCSAKPSGGERKKKPTTPLLSPWTCRRCITRPCCVHGCSIHPFCPCLGLPPPYLLPCLGRGTPKPTCLKLATAMRYGRPAPILWPPQPTRHAPKRALRTTKRTL